MKQREKLAAGLLVLLFPVILLVSMMDAFGPSSTQHHRALYNEILPIIYDENEHEHIKRMKATGDYGECEIRPPVFPDHEITPTFSASYPGSGAKMTWVLIEAITGLQTHNDIMFDNTRYAVSTKTHYPNREGTLLKGEENVPRAIIVLRHPLDAFPSYFNYLYEMENHLENHSTRAPIQAWISWRDAHFEGQLQNWQHFVEYWMDKFSPADRVIICFEKIINDVYGPIEAGRLAEFLGRSDGVNVHPPELIPCIWHKVVKYKDSNNARRRLESMEGLAKFDIDPNSFALSDPSRPNSHRDGPKYIPPYNLQQLNAVKSMLSSLLDKYREESSLNPVLRKYIHEAEMREEEMRKKKEEKRNAAVL
uniref:Sulfotransferase domain-containing protein n=1 Tax=Ditylum brightwellii TaxID=49249 RepID=A0A6V2G186_9STRA